MTTNPVENETQMNDEGGGPKGVGGFLLYIGLSVWVGVIYTAVEELPKLYTIYSDYLEVYDFSELFSSFGLIGLIQVFEPLISSAAFFIYQITLGVTLFRKSVYFPFLFVLYFVLGVLSTVLTKVLGLLPPQAVTYAASPISFPVELLLSIVTTFLMCWYILYSRRVRNTFVPFYMPGLGRFKREFATVDEAPTLPEFDGIEDSREQDLTETDEMLKISPAPKTDIETEIDSDADDSVDSVHSDLSEHAGRTNKADNPENLTDEEHDDDMENTDSDTR